MVPMKGLPSPGNFPAGPTGGFVSPRILLSIPNPPQRGTRGKISQAIRPERKAYGSRDCLVQTWDDTRLLLARSIRTRLMSVGEIIQVEMKHGAPGYRTTGTAGFPLYLSFPTANPPHHHYRFTDLRQVYPKGRSALYNGNGI